MSTDLESRLRAAFTEAARLEVPDREPVPALPPARTTERPDHRRVWVASGLLAAACVVVAAAAVWITHTDVVSRPIPALTSTPTVTPTRVVTTASAPVIVPPTPTTTSSGGSAVAATHQVTVQGGIVLTVPADWAVASSSDVIGTCLTIGGVAEQHVTGSAASVLDNCQLVVAVDGGGVDDPSTADPDVPGVTGQGALCGSGLGTGTVTTTAANDATVGGQTGDYRAFSGSCFAGTDEQWSLTTAPVVVFTRAVADPASTEAAARQAVASAQLPSGRSAVRVSDKGFVTGLSGATVQLDRVTERDGTLVDNNPTSYPYTFAANAVGSYLDANGQVTVSRAEFDTLVAGGTVDGVPPLSGLLMTVRTDGIEITSFTLTPRP